MQGGDDFAGAFIVAALVVVWLVRCFLRKPSVRGRLGEARVNTALRRKLDKDTYTCIHDLILPTPDGTTQIDHVIVSPFGIFVIETKNYSGWIYGGERQKSWTQTFRRKKHRFQNPLRQNYKHVKAVQAMLGVPQAIVHSVVIFVGDAKFKTPMPNNVATLRGGIRHIRSFNIPAISYEQIDDYLEILRSPSRGAGTAGHSEHLKNLQSKSTSPFCPRCGDPMVQRSARRGKNAGKKFWGCSAFPRCRAVQDIG